MRPKWEVVLTYLLEIGSVEESEPVEGATQRGISEALSLPLPHVPRILKPLLSEGLVVERKEHIKGKRRRLLTYFLTERGVKRAREIFKDAMEDVVDVGGRRMKLSEVRRIHADYTGPLSPLLLGVGLSGRKEVEIGEVPEWYRRVRKGSLKSMNMGSEFYVEEWEFPLLVALLSEMGFSCEKVEGDLLRVVSSDGAVVVVAKGEREGFRPFPPPSFESWKEACPGLEGVAEELYRISGGEIDALRRLVEMESEVRECLKKNSPRECALMVFIGEDSRANR